MVRCIILTHEPETDNVIAPSPNVRRRVSVGDKNDGWKSPRTGTTSKARNRWNVTASGGKLIPIMGSPVKRPKMRYKTTARHKVLKLNRISPIAFWMRYKTTHPCKLLSCWDLSHLL